MTAIGGSLAYAFGSLVGLFPEAIYLIFAEGSMFGALRQLLATHVEQPGKQSA